MREKIIKLLKSDNADDRALGKEYLRRFYSQEIFREGGNHRISILLPSDLNRILNTHEFQYDPHSPWMHSSNLLIIMKDDNWSTV